MTYQAILVASLFLLLAFGIDRLSHLLRVPSVVVLILTGLIGKPVLASFGIAIPGLNTVVPILGAIGLVLIVLEGALDIELSRERLHAASRAFVLAIAGFFACMLAFLGLLVAATPLTPFQAAILAVPFAVISSAVAIPSSGFLPAPGREFVVYESSISDILAVLVFFSLLGSDGTAAGILRSFAGGGFLSLVLAVVCALGLTLVMLRIDGHIRFIPLLAGMFGLYAAGKLFHLSPLIMVLFFGLALNNPGLITRLRPFRHWLDAEYSTTLREFKLLTGEMTFAVRGFFFILLGYWTDLSVLASFQAWLGAVLVLAFIYGSRHAMLRLGHSDYRAALTWLAPRGLITVLLYLAAKDAMPVPAYMDGVVLLVVLISASLTTVGRLRWDRAATVETDAATVRST